MRGMYTAGVLDVLLDKQVSFDGIIGVSAGALFGVNYLSGQRGRVLRYNKKYNSDKSYMGLRPLLSEGNIINTEYAYVKVARELDAFDDVAYRKSGVPFYAVATDIQTGRANYFRITSVFEQMDILRASASMPFVSRPVEINGRLYLDGGIADSIPFTAMQRLGYDRLAVVLTRDSDYVKKPMSPRMISLFYRKYPQLARQMKRRHKVYNHRVAQLREQEKQGRVFVLRPSRPIEIKRMESDPDKLQAVYDLGVRDAQKQQERLSAFLRQ